MRATRLLRAASLERRSARAIAAIAAALALSCAGCKTIDFRTGAPRGGRVQKLTAHFGFWGLVGDDVVDLDLYCPEGAARWVQRETFFDGLATWLTLGLYARRSIDLECVPTAKETSP